MKLSKINISQDQLDINFKFYQFLKTMNGESGFSENERLFLLEQYYLHKKSKEIVLNSFNDIISKIKKAERAEDLKSLFFQIKTDHDFYLFIFSLKLMGIKDLLLAEAKLINVVEIIKKKKIHPLSLEFDTIGRNKSYYTRVNGALLSLLFFEKLENKKIDLLAETSHEFIKDLIKEYKEVKKYNVEPNQIFMLMFNESINQSIKSTAGKGYEDIIYDILLGLGIKKEDLKKVHDDADKSTEYDFFFHLNGRSYGIGAKRTLRERYKQFIKTAQSSKIDVMIEITLGLDLPEDKAKTIRQHNIYLFVADEIYLSRSYLQKMKGVYKASDLTLTTLKNLK